MELISLQTQLAHYALCSKALKYALIVKYLHLRKKIHQQHKKILYQEPNLLIYLLLFPL